MKTRYYWMLTLISLIVGTASPFTFRVQAATRTYTFAVQNSLQIPNAVQTEISSYSKIPVSLPKSIKLDSYLPPKWQLAIDLDVSPNEYGMDIFERPKDSKTSNYAMATLIGDTETVSNLNSFSIPYDFDVRRFTAHKTIKLVDNMYVTNYRNTKSYDNAMIWSDKRWNYIAEGLGGAYESKTPGMANTIAGFVAKNRFPVQPATHGYVQAIWAGNRPEFRVTWTCNNKQWYSLSMATLSETLKTAKTVTAS